MGLKALYQRFRKWQQEPFVYKAGSPDPQHCANCGNDYVGKYCPVCGQSCKEGRVTWKSVDKDIRVLLSIRDPGGLIPLIVQLFGRTGYLINDYISGRKKVCSGLARKFLIITACTLLVQSKTGQESVYQMMFFPDRLQFMSEALEWLSKNLGWAVLIQTLLLLFPTWLLFRQAPRNTRHSLPEGFYIQLFMSCLVLLLVMLRCVLGNWVLLLIPIFYYIAYYRLFGYGVWGTIWRTVLCLGSVIYLFSGLMMTVKYLQLSGFSASHSIWASIGIVAAFILVDVGLVALGWWIGKRGATKKTTE